MTRAPEPLLELRRLLLTHLNPHGLTSAEVGIVGDADHRGGYHCGSDRVVTRDYSVVESDRDRAGLTLDAAALDVGMFQLGEHNLRTFSTWCVAQCIKNTPDSRDIREIIYSPDGRTVRRWDRLGRRTSGDESHLWHTHFSFFRDAIKAGRDQTPLFRRYLTTIGLIKAESTEDDMTPSERWVLHVMNYRVEALKANRVVVKVPARTYDGVTFEAFEEPNLLALAVGADKVDEPEVIAGVLRGMTPELIGSALVLAGMTPERLAAIIPADFASDVVDELSRRTARQ